MGEVTTLCGDATSHFLDAGHVSALNGYTTAVDHLCSVFCGGVRCSVPTVGRIVKFFLKIPIKSDVSDFLGLDVFRICCCPIDDVPLKGFSTVLSYCAVKVQLAVSLKRISFMFPLSTFETTLRVPDILVVVNFVNR